MKRIVRWMGLITLTFGFTAITACSTESGDKPPEATVEERQGPHELRDMPPETSNPSVHFDLGGPCLPLDAFDRYLTEQQESELSSSGKWEELIGLAKEHVRGNCSVPYRWHELFTILVRAQHYGEAVQVVSEVAARGFAFPHAVLSRADPAFLVSAEFTSSAMGAEYARREIESQQSLRLAEDRLSSMELKALPPNPYRSVGACPFECCTYREWRTTSVVELRESIDSERVVAEIPAGTQVQAITGEVRVEPEPYAVLTDHGVLKAGDVVFLLDSLGEGEVNYWYGGKLNPDLGPEGYILLDYTTEDCQVNSADSREDPCWLRKLRPLKTYLNEWWVKIRMANGNVGWVLNTDQFENTDACG